MKTVVSLFFVLLVPHLSFAMPCLGSADQGRGGATYCAKAHFAATEIESALRESNFNLVPNSIQIEANDKVLQYAGLTADYELVTFGATDAQGVRYRGWSSLLTVDGRSCGTDLCGWLKSFSHSQVRQREGGDPVYLILPAFTMERGFSAPLDLHLERE